ESYAWEASRRAKMLGEEAHGLLQNYIPKEKVPTLVVYNTLNWSRSGLFKVYIDHQILPRYKKFKLINENGTEAKAQAIEHHSDGTYWVIWADNVPAFGFKKYLIQVEGDAPKQKQEIEKTEINTLENQWYRISIDIKKGAISGLFDKEINKELVDPKAEWKLGEFIYETLGNRSQMESKKLDNYKRQPLSKVWFDGYEEGPVWNTVRFRGNTEAANGDGLYTFEIRLFNTSKRIDLAYFIEKRMVIEPEGIYISFPFALENGQLSFDVQGGEIRAGIDQIPGSSNDWNTVQNYARLSNSNTQILLSSKETPLMQFGGINTGRYKAGATPETTHIYGWPMNNYWVTNFNAEQHGGFEWNYSISSAVENSQTAATRFGWENMVPFLSRVLPGGGNGGGKSEGSFISGWPENIVLVSAMPGTDGKSANFHVRETGGKTANIQLKHEINGKILKLTEVDVLGNSVQSGSTEIKAFESKFLRVEF
ncbi:MAG TPA: glycoside hydrolase family 38 C-terminal domain-containing protein, partial [Draconibacterium sp.]|nr:glycoside hydrolase family 38 C-terminal domain-containing protein [Draconibacterium sp.]